MRVASSNPPGTNPIGFLFFISYLMLLGFTDYIPHSRSSSPINGRAKINLLASPVILDIFESSAFIFVGIQYDNTLWGCRQNKDAYYYGIYY